MSKPETYVTRIQDRLAAALPGCDEQLLGLYTLLALTSGKNTSLEAVHDAWSVWRTTTRPDHPSIVPFDELKPEVQELDRKYADAIHDAAQA